MHPYKRRRLDTQTTLTRPFRSPLPSAPRPGGQSRPATQTKADASNRSADDPAILTGAVNIDQSSPPPTAVTTELIASTAPTGKAPNDRSPVVRRHPITTRPTSHDPEYLSLQKQHSSLSLELKHISASVDTTSQALKILNSHTDQDLERLIQKWRDISREAAEELFSVAKDRVNRMGGVGAWRDKYQRQQGHLDQFASGTVYDNPWADQNSLDEDDLTEDQREQLEIARDEARQEAEKYGLLQGEAEQQPSSVVMTEKDDDSFTIDMMLNQLNVDLDLIGYDVQAQRWV